MLACLFFEPLRWPYRQYYQPRLHWTIKNNARLMDISALRIARMLIVLHMEKNNQQRAQWHEVAT